MTGAHELRGGASGTRNDSSSKSLGGRLHRVIVMLRAIVFFVLGMAVACAAFYSGAGQWANDRWLGYWNYPIATAPTPYAPDPYSAAPPPVSQPYPYPAPSPYPAPTVDAPLPPVDTPPPANVQEETPDDYSTPERPEQTYQPPEGGPPVSVQSVDGGAPISLHISIGHRNADSGDCLPVYIVINEAGRPVFLSQRERAGGSERGPRDKTILQPGERRVACAADVYRARGDRRFDYYRQNAWYGPDAIDLPPPVIIRVKG